MTKLPHEERSCRFIALAVGHEKRVQFAYDLILDLIEVLRSLVLGDDHAVQDLHGVDTKLVVMTKAKVHNMVDQAVQRNLMGL
jgi:hypothetical protein